jgi:hypothetical protein
MPFVGDSKGVEKIAYGPEIIVALEQLRAGTSTHWFTYNFEVSRQRGELVREGVRLHDGAHPFRRMHQVRREKNRVHYDAEAREKLAAMAEANLEARIKRLQNKVNNVGRPLDRYDHRRNALLGWDHPVEEPPVRSLSISLSISLSLSLSRSLSLSLCLCSSFFTSLLSVGLINRVGGNTVLLFVVCSWQECQLPSNRIGICFVVKACT